ncbi:MAG: hypothetical protein ACJ735_05700 [Actinomycetes bacterium]
MTRRSRRTRIRLLSILAAMTAALVTAGTTSVLSPAQAASPPTISPSHPSYSYDAGPFTFVNVAGLLIGSCDVPDGCVDQLVKVSVPPGYYDSLRAAGKIGAVEITMTWTDNVNDFDLGLLDTHDNVLATSGFGNSNFEKIVYTELPSGTYDIQSVVFRAQDEGFHVSVQFVALTPGTSSARVGGDNFAFGNSSPVTFERSSGEPDLVSDPATGDFYADAPLGAGTNSGYWKSTDGGRTWLPLGQDRPNQNPLTGNLAGGGDSQTSIGPDHRVCISELNTLISLGVACSSNGGKFFGPTSQVADATTPLVDRQWQAATADGQQFISAQFGVVSAGPSQPGVRVFGDNGTGVFVKKLEIDTGAAMKSYRMVADPSSPKTLVEAYLRSNLGADRATNPHQLMIWRSTDGATTAKRFVVANLPTTPGNNFASVSVDRQGNTYVAWSEQGTWDIYYTMATKAALNAASDNSTPAWTKPVRVNADGPSDTAIQPSIMVGDTGRVFIGFFGSHTIGNPDNLGLGTGEWHAFVSESTNGACQLTATCGASGRPTFHQAQVDEHPVQFGGICLGGTGCGGDPYYGDRSMLEFLTIAFDPKTGGAQVIYTDSSQSEINANFGASQTVIQVARQSSGPSAYAGKPAVHDPGAYGSSITDARGDAGFPTFTLLPKQAAPGADITKVALSLPDGGHTLRTTIHLADASALDTATVAGKGKQLFIGVRFATHDDVFWVGWVHDLGGGGTPAAGHLDCSKGLLVCGYETDSAIHASSTGPSASTNSVTIDVPVADLTTKLLRPAGTKAPVVHAFVPGSTPLWAVTGYSFASPTTVDAANVPKNPLDVAPAFTFTTTAQHDVITPVTPTHNRGLAMTGLPAALSGLALLLCVGGLLTWRRLRAD